MTFCDIIHMVMNMSNKFNWAILGCGNIANDFAIEMNKMGGKVYFVANRTYEKAIAFAKKCNIEKICDNIDELQKAVSLVEKNNLL